MKRFHPLLLSLLLTFAAASVLSATGRDAREEGRARELSAQRGEPDSDDEWRHDSHGHDRFGHHQGHEPWHGHGEEHHHDGGCHHGNRIPVRDSYERHFATPFANDPFLGRKLDDPNIPDLEKERMLVERARLDPSERIAYDRARIRNAATVSPGDLTLDVNGDRRVSDADADSLMTMIHDELTSLGPAYMAMKDQWDQDNMQDPDVSQRLALLRDRIKSDMDACAQTNCDSDADGVADLLDNCPSDANVDQANADGDMVGDVCDSDDDNDGIPDELDSCGDLLIATDACVEWGCSLKDAMSAPAASALPSGLQQTLVRRTTDACDLLQAGELRRARDVYRELYRLLVAQSHHNGSTAVVDLTRDVRALTGL